jgi:hypothetical protein
MPLDLIRGWTPVRVKKTRQTKEAILSRNLCERGPFSLHGNHTRTSPVFCVDRRLYRGGRTGPAGPNHAPGTDRAAITLAHRQLRADAAADPEFRHAGSGGTDHRAAGRAARR